MPLKDYRSVFLPYCLKQMSDGSHLPLNREYKPVGMRTRDFVQYEDYSANLSITGIGEKKARQLSHNGSSKLSQIYLYDDSCNPLNSAEDWNNYQQRLALLAPLEFAD